MSEDKSYMSYTTYRTQFCERVKGVCEDIASSVPLRSKALPLEALPLRQAFFPCRKAA